MSKRASYDRSIDAAIRSLQIGRISRALTYLHNANKIIENAESTYLLATSYYLAKKYRLALDWASKSEVYQAHPDLLALKILIYSDSHRHHDVIREGRRGVLLFPSHSLLLLNFSKSLLAIGEFRESERYAIWALRAGGPTYETYSNLALAQLGQGKHQQALSAISLVESLGALSHGHLLARATINLSLGKNDCAKIDFHKYCEGFISAQGVRQSVKECAYALIDVLVNISVVPSVDIRDQFIERYLIAVGILHRSLDQLPSRGQSQEVALLSSLLLRWSTFWIGYLITNPKALLSQIGVITSRLLKFISVNPDFQFDEINKIRKEKIKIGIISDLFGMHISYWISDLINQLDQTKYETYAFPVNLPASEALAKQLSKFNHVDRLFLTESSLGEVVQSVRSVDLDIIIFPEVGMSIPIRLLSCTRLARRQCMGWGHPVTSGSECMDFFLSSELMESSDSDIFYTERLIRLPAHGVYFSKERIFEFFDKFNLIKCKGSPHVVGSRKVGVFQSIIKISPEDDEFFRMILTSSSEVALYFIEGELPNSTEQFRLRLFRKLPTHVHSRVHFIPRMIRYDYLVKMQSMDLLIDTPSWSGGNTTLDAFLLGKIVVGFHGNQLRSRHTSAFYKVMDINGLTARDHYEAVEIVLNLLVNNDLRNRLEEKLNRSIDRLFNHSLVVDFVDNFIQNKDSHFSIVVK